MDRERWIDNNLKSTRSDVFSVNGNVTIQLRRLMTLPRPIAYYRPFPPSIQSFTCTNLAIVA